MRTPSPRLKSIAAMPIWLLCFAVLLSACTMTKAPTDNARADSAAPAQTLRVATFNIALNDGEAGGVIRRLEGDDAVARQLASIIQTVRPDVLLLNELDYDPEGLSLELFQKRYLEQGEQPLKFAYSYIAPVNTGVASGMDLNNDGKNNGPEDAHGYGRHPGQYGMAVLSRFPIQADQARTFQLLRWSAMPNAMRPVNADGSNYFSDAIWQQLRLSSKSHWDLPIAVPGGVFHLLAAHPTPPVFDGPEDRNGHRNHDEIRLFADYLYAERDQWIVDDQGRRGGLAPDRPFVIVGDYNADQDRGASTNRAIDQFLLHPRIQAVSPTQQGVEYAAATADFGPQVGTMRVDYVLPSTHWQVSASGVYWPRAGEPGHDWTAASDHRLVWVDVILEKR